MQVFVPYLVLPYWVFVYHDYHYDLNLNFHKPGTVVQKLRPNVEIDNDGVVSVIVFVVIVIIIITMIIPTVLNVAEKPSVARALASVFAQLPGSRERGMRREAAQIFTHENVCFPSVDVQGDGRIVQGPSEFDFSKFLVYVEI